MGGLGGGRLVGTLREGLPVDGHVLEVHTFYNLYDLHCLD